MSEVKFEEIVEQVIDACDIVEVVGRYVQLKRAGSNYQGLCPFHNEKTPSFVVSPEKRIFKCFGCGVAGNVIKFVQMIENLSFWEAIERLAAEAGITIEKSSSRLDSKKEEMYALSQMAARRFYKNLRHGANSGLKYVVSRGISPETARKFGIGYAKDEWRDMLTFFSESSLSREGGLELGIFAKNKDGELYDKFRNRVIFPILNTRDKVIGFGGRAIDDSMPKYLNSSESLIFKKKDNLYGLNLAKGSIRKENLAIMVEGYMDVVSLVDNGVENVVATLGTALTQEQAKLLRRYTDTVVLSYDSDSAGQAATMRGIDILQAAGFRIRILTLDEGKDPDEYIRKNGKKAFLELVDNADPYMKYKINGIKKKYDMNTTDGSIRFLEEISRELKKINSPGEQSLYVKQVAEMTKIPESSIEREIAGVSEEKPLRKLPQSEPDKNAEENILKINRKKMPVVKLLIKLMLSNGSFIPIVTGETVIANYFYGSGYENIFEQIVMNYRDDSEIDIDQLKEALNDWEVELLEDITQNILPIAQEEKTLMECAKKIKISNLDKRKKELLKKMEVLSEEEDKEELDRLSTEIRNIDMDVVELKKEYNE